MHWILTVSRVEDAFVVLEGDAGEFYLPRSEMRDAQVGDIVRLEHGVREGRARLGYQLIASV
ncbi:MAG TPA: hypothetical protein VHN99_06365 [Deinococcales bacterium]|nr:hypothetical protein [Deinococcales bacterium]